MSKVGMLLIFLIGLFLRFLYFPDNIYFGFDQTRDAYEVLDIIKGDLKIVGPSTSFEGLNHGVLYYYILAPLYFIGAKSPEVVSLFLRIFNAAGIFLIFLIGSVLFNKKVGIISALLFALSFEQTQFALYMGNPSLAVLSIGLMYLGLALVIFREKKIGLVLAFLGLGFSIQFQFALIYLTTPFVLIVIFFRKKFLRLPLKIWIMSFLGLLFSLSTFILAEIKYDFRSTKGLLALLDSGNQKNILDIFNTFVYTINKIGSFNIVGEFKFGYLILLVILLSFIFLFYKDKFINQLIFLGIWYFSILATVIISGGVADLKSNVPLYYPNIGVSLALLIFISLIITLVAQKSKWLGLGVLIIIIFFNGSMILKFNPKGTISEINVQQGMLLGKEKEVIDFVYNQSFGDPFAVKAVTMPFFVNTTWSYLFEWYGQKKYGYLPIWNGKNAEGFPGNLKIQDAQENLPEKRFLIIEPTRGIPPHLIYEYLQEEGYFTKVLEEQTIGGFTIQKRVKI